MRVIYKYKLEWGTTHIELDANAKVLLAAMQNGELMLWVEGDFKPDKLKRRTFSVYATGEAITQEAKDLKYISTIFESRFVWHVYELLIR